jgi:hypothetical protein
MRNFDELKKEEMHPPKIHAVSILTRPRTSRRSARRKFKQPLRSFPSMHTITNLLRRIGTASGPSPWPFPAMFGTHLLAAISRDIFSRGDMYSRKLSCLPRNALAMATSTGGCKVMRHFAEVLLYAKPRCEQAVSCGEAQDLICSLPL